jgi:hypothetical protein
MISPSSFGVRPDGDFQDERLQRLDTIRPYVIETLRHIPSDVLDRYNISVGLTGLFSQVGFMMGVQCILTALIDQPEELKAAIGRAPQGISAFTQEMKIRPEGNAEPTRTPGGAEWTFLSDIAQRVCSGWNGFVNFTRSARTTESSRAWTCPRRLCVGSRSGILTAQLSAPT